MHIKSIIRNNCLYKKTVYVLQPAYLPEKLFKSAMSVAYNNRHMLNFIQIHFKRENMTP